MSLATLAATQLVAQRNDASAQLRIAQAQYEQLLAGESATVRLLADTSLKNTEQALARVISEEAEKVGNARKKLLSSELSTRAVYTNEEAVAPTITGSYACTEEGTYTIEVYSSQAHSGFSYRFGGLESGTAEVTTDQPSAFGMCGLYIQFNESGRYDKSEWLVGVPNEQSDTYVSNKNLYTLALEQQKNAVAAAQDAQALAVQENAQVHEDPRTEEVSAARATIDSARARIAEIDAQIDDRSVIAPFDGIITNVQILKGETAPATPIITILAADAFELKARIPEIDITKIQTGQKATAVFDAQSTELYTGTITYVSPLATLIDGVAYFEAVISLERTPEWIRSGLNADVDIVISKKENVLRIPKRYIVTDGAAEKSVFVQNGNKRATTSIIVQSEGNDGYAEITGLTEGQTIIAP